ncbi:hypothetical protein ASE01_05250 [Nocardioides sp. Root190]|uniref:hypothetical protein n=1 Tax=Nocardioides sp. Root190 TaxID=1736488 RepID=UPI0006F85E62|nr:hypothetical protein [Nocardioides sp. Root190]KRB78655.1 hypothetical protein ASE01_05250 [Nocardioides sp. Root190]
MQDLVDRLHAELAGAPGATFAVADTMAAGRRAVRRRRIAAGTAALAIAVAVGGAAWAVAPGGDGSSRGQAAVDPSPTPTPTATAPPTADTGWEPDEVLRTDDAGRVSLNPAAEEIDRHSFLEGGTAYHVALGGEEYYALASVDDSISTQRLPAQGMSLVEWANAQAVLGSGDDDGAFGSNGADGSGWVTIDESSRLDAVPGARIVEQRADPGLGDSFAAPGDPTALAEVVVDGTTYFLAVRSIDGATDAIPYRRDDVVTTLDAFLSYCLERYATNDDGGSEGLR